MNAQCHCAHVWFTVLWMRKPTIIYKKSQTKECMQVTDLCPYIPGMQIHINNLCRQNFNLLTDFHGSTDIILSLYAASCSFNLIVIKIDVSPQFGKVFNVTDNIIISNFEWQQTKVLYSYRLPPSPSQVWFSVCAPSTRFIFKVLYTHKCTCMHGMTVS